MSQAYSYPTLHGDEPSYENAAWVQSMVAGLILEGVTGSGKSSTLSALSARSDFKQLLEHGDVFTEEVTFGDFMQESRTDPYSTRRLEAALRRIEERAIPNSRYVYVLERFHFSYNTFARDWIRYQTIERRLEVLNCGVILLTIPDPQVVLRSLERADMVGTDWVQQLVGFFGSYEDAVNAIIASARRRREDVKASLLPSIEIDTSSSDWPAYLPESAPEVVRNSARQNVRGQLRVQPDKLLAVTGWLGRTAPKRRYGDRCFAFAPAELL